MELKNKVLRLIKSSDDESINLGLSLVNCQIEMTPSSSIFWYCVMHPLYKELTRNLASDLQERLETVSANIHKRTGLKLKNDMQYSTVVNYIQKNFDSVSPESMNILLESLIQNTFRLMAKKEDSAEKIKEIKNKIPILNGYKS